MLIRNMQKTEEKKETLALLQASLRLVWILGGATLPHLLTMGDGCPFRPLISVQYLMHDYNTLFMLFCQVYAVSAYLPSEILINVPFAIKFVTRELFSTYIERANMSLWQRYEQLL